MSSLLDTLFLFSFLLSFIIKQLSYPTIFVIPAPTALSLPLTLSLSSHLGPCVNTVFVIAARPGYLTLQRPPFPFSHQIESFSLSLSVSFSLFFVVQNNSILFSRSIASSSQQKSCTTRGANHRLHEQSKPTEQEKRDRNPGTLAAGKNHAVIFTHAHLRSSLSSPSWPSSVFWFYCEPSR
ncbi:MAG: hypothetical protein JOS17DRAFT_183790 [Linnemannia elongata]|nr:MAG: hypothetical protein JOS17DRAFT_183790 [Linnemannia elongata]